MSAFSSRLYSAGGNHQKCYLLRMSSILTTEFKTEKKKKKTTKEKKTHLP